VQGCAPAIADPLEQRATAATASRDYCDNGEESFHLVGGGERGLGRPNLPRRLVTIQFAFDRLRKRFGLRAFIAACDRIIGIVAPRAGRQVRFDVVSLGARDCRRW